MKRLDEMKPDFEDCERRINRLKQIETELAGLSTSGFEAHVGFINPLLRDPLALEEVENEFNELKAEIEDARFFAKIKKGVTAPHPPGIMFDEGKSISSTGDQLLGRKEYEGAIKAYEDALSRFNQAAQDAPSISPQFETSLNNAIARVKANIATCQIGIGQQLVDSVMKKLKTDDYEGAANMYGKAKSHFQNALKMATESGDTRSANNARGLLEETARRIEQAKAAVDEKKKATIAPKQAVPQVSVSPGVGIARHWTPEGYQWLASMPKGSSNVEISKVKDARTGAIMVLKVPRLSLSSWGTVDPVFARLIDEAERWEQATRLGHPNILPLHASGVAPVPWIITEYMAHGSLRDKIGLLSLKDALSIELKLCDALVEAHNKSLVHRDIKPENILFDKEDNPRLTDWGIGAVLMELQLEGKGGTARGTAEYSAPEQIFPSKYGETGVLTDIYQCGVVLYEMLTGEPPFTGRDYNEVVAKILETQPEPPSRACRGLPVSLDSIILSALTKQPSQRREQIAQIGIMRNDLSRIEESLT